MNNKIQVPCTLEERISKSGTPYFVLIVKLTDKYEKRVFLDSAELELIKLKANK